MRRCLLALLALLCAHLAGPAAGHALQPGYLELTPLGESRWQVVWRVPDVQGRAMAITPRLPASCLPADAPRPTPAAGAWAARWEVVCAQGLAGGQIEIAGLPATRTDVLLRYGLETDGAPGPVDQTARLTPQSASLTIPPRAGPLSVAGSYFGLGVEHILTGVDHLLFVAALLLVAGPGWPLVGAITAFTVAHSLTLGAAALGWFIVAQPPVEILIALSIAFLAAEALRGSQGLSARAPWIVAFGFGLLHGLGFGTALSRIGLPDGAVPLALATFNIGVEAGQILFLLALLAAARVLGGTAGPPLRGAMRTSLCYAIGILAMVWTFERAASAFLT